MNDVEQKILDEFKRYHSKLQQWGGIVDHLLLTVLKPLDCDHRIKIYPAFRLKENVSYVYKALYRRKVYSNPLLDIEDKVGTRIVLLKSTDIDEAAETVLKFPGWTAVVTKNIKDIIEEKPNEFDYQSIHIVVRPNEESGEIKKEDFDILSCEIQIRTLLQHAFAEISHDSTYKGPYKNDRGIIRSLAKSMALMESTDDYFCKVYELMTDDSRRFKNYLNELVTLFQKFKPGFDRKSLDVDVTDSIFELLVLKDVSIQELDVFIQKYQAKLANVIDKGNHLITQQPVFLLLAYYIENMPNFTKKHWPLSQAFLKECFYLLGVSFMNY